MRSQTSGDWSHLTLGKLARPDVWPPNTSISPARRATRVGELARLRYQNGTLVSEDHRQLVAALTRTWQLVVAPHKGPIFEAAFQRDGVVVRVDILEPDEWGGWKLIEVKNSGGVRAYQLLDAATQAWVLRGNQLCVSAIFIRHVERPHRPGWRDHFRTRFGDADVQSTVLLRGKRFIGT